MALLRVRPILLPGHILLLKAGRILFVLLDSKQVFDIFLARLIS